MTFWAAGAAVGGAVIGGIFGKKGASKQAKATKAAVKEQRRQFDLTRGDYAPYREAGTRALGQLETENGQLPTPEEVMSDPGYQFGLDQGQQALDRKASAAGGRFGGAQLKAASEYGTNYASTGYGAAYQRRQDRLNRLAALAGIGQTATQGSAMAGAGSANAISGLMSSQGDASAASSLYQGNIWGNAANQLGAMGKKWSTPQASPSQPGWAGFGGAPGEDEWYG
jgi:hypothetical protein